MDLIKSYESSDDMELHNCPLSLFTSAGMASNRVIPDSTSGLTPPSCSLPCSSLQRRPHKTEMSGANVKFVGSVNGGTMEKINVGPEGGSPPALEVPQPTAAARVQIFPKKQGARGRAAVNHTATPHFVLAKAPPTSAAKGMLVGKQNRNKQMPLQVCVLCRKIVHLIRNHLLYTHKLEDHYRCFLLSYYRTRNLKCAVYECQDCVVRFTNSYRDHLGHDVIHVKEKNSPPNFLYKCKV